ncbi:MAG: hypothetical protein IPG20_18955 [Gammaproteobacteria bacterium]|nr:hypothetical protein [Gammaproteobacteria bacterium]
MAVKKPTKVNPASTDQAASAPPDAMHTATHEAAHSATRFRILKQAQCPTISGKSDLTYNIACDPQKSLYLRVASNSGGGFFSQEWVALKDIQKALSAGSPISAIRLMPLFRGQSVNTPGFLLAVLAAEKLIRPMPGKQRVHELVQNADFQARMEKLIASNANLPDDAAGTKPKLPPKPKAVKADLSKRKPGRKPTTKTA